MLFSTFPLDSNERYAAEVLAREIEGRCPEGLTKAEIMAELEEPN